MKEIKKTMIDGILDRISKSPFMLVTDYGGMTVPQFDALREKLAESGARFQVAKNTFVRRAAKEAEIPDDISGLLTGQTAIVTGNEDVCTAVKILKETGKKGGLPKIRGGVLDKRVLDEANVIALADLPPKEVLQAQLLGVLNQPAQRLVTVLNQPAQQMVTVLNEPLASLLRVMMAKKEKG